MKALLEMFKLTFVIFAVIWTVSSAVVGKDLSKDTAKKTKFNLGESDKFLRISTVEMEFLKNISREFRTCL